MGYYTRFSLDVFGDGVDVDHKSEIGDKSEYGDYLFEDSHKWYDHEEDMIAHSRLYPNTLFVLSGEGEEPGDLWRKYFKNGKVQTVRAEITYEDFDESKLKNLEV